MSPTQGGGARVYIEPRTRGAGAVLAPPSAPRYATGANASPTRTRPCRSTFGAVALAPAAVVRE